MTIHVLDTGALLLLHNKHNPPLLRELRQVTDDSEIVIPALVITEASQAAPLYQKRIEMILEIAEVEDVDYDVADRAARCLRESKRAKCGECAGFVGPSIVDAVVMAFAGRYADVSSQVIVHTGDMRDMTVLRDAFFNKVQLQKC